MSRFTEGELRYLTTEKVLGRLATVDPDGQPHVVPVGWRYNPDLDTIDVSGRDFARTHKFRNARRDGRATLVVDDVLPPWQPRAVMIQAAAEALDGDGDGDGQAVIRLTPRKVVSWGL